MLDLLLRDVKVYPGEGEPWLGDVGVSGGKIAALAPRIDVEASRILELAGLAVAPGFIDMHSHCALRPFVDPSLEPKIRQGFTTELINPDGLGPAPVSADGIEARVVYLSGLEGIGPSEWPWRTIDEYLDALDATRPTTSLCPLVPHGAVREFVMNGDNRPPTSDELKRMCREFAQGMEAGAWGASFGLIYLPAAYSATDELVAVSREIGERGGFLVPHVRSESGQLLEAVREMIAVAEQSGSGLNISHLKVFGQSNAHKLEPLIELVDSAADTGLDVTFDQYPYGAGATMLAAVLPPWMQEGGALATLDRLRDPALRDRIVRDMHDPNSSAENLFAQAGPEAIVLTDTGGDDPGNVVGLSLAQIADARGNEAADVVITLLLETDLAASMLLHHSTDATVRAIATHPKMLIGSDGIFAARPHPRLWGTAPRFLGRFAIQERLVPMEEAIARLTARAARRIGLTDRGSIEEGLRADLVVFDPNTLVDNSTYDDPLRPASGIEWVIVAGQISVDPAGLTGVRAGGVARRP
jgi:N-acyl-D-amino-acid deacylase